MFLGDFTLRIWSSMNFLVIAIEHPTQIVPLRDDAQETVKQKGRLEQTVNDAITRERVDLICEESDPVRLSIAQRIAFEHHPRISWKNIVMTAQERLEAGIWEALQYRPSRTVFPDDGMPPYQIQYRIPEDDTRENFFRDAILAEALSLNARSVLILCGDMHVEPLKDKLEAVGHAARTDHSLVTVRHWE